MDIFGRNFYILQVLESLQEMALNFYGIIFVFLQCVLFIIENQFSSTELILRNLGINAL